MKLVVQAVESWARIGVFHSRRAYWKSQPGATLLNF